MINKSMNTELKNISEIKDNLEKLSFLFHDVRVKEYLCETDRFSFVVHRPVYELAKKSKKYGFIPVWIVPIVETKIVLFPIVLVDKLEEDSKNSDWLLDLELVGDRLFVKGVANKYSINLNDDSKLSVYDIGQPDWNNQMSSFHRPKLF
jgi:hypothetical protein